MKAISSLFGGGGDKQAALAKRQAESAQRRQLAELARQQSEVDQQAASTTPRASRGRRLLTFLNDGPGQKSLG